MDAREIDVLLVGAGPIGIELAVALARRGIEYVHVEAGAIGSTIEWYAPQTHFFSSPERIEIAGVPLQTLDQTKATREEYLNYLRSVVLQFDLPIRTFERVVRLEKTEAGFAVTTQSARGEARWLARRIVLAIGDMHAPREIGVPGEDLPHVSHYFRDPHVYFRRRVLIVGGRNSAVEAAIRAVRVGADVTLSYRGADFDGDRVKSWLLPEVRAMIRDGRMRFLPRTTVRAIRAGTVALEPCDGGDPFDLEADAVLLLTGYAQDPDLFLQAGVTLERESRRPRLDPRTMETNVPGLYVAGTAVAGTQLGGVKEFIETSHVHVARIVAALAGEAPPEGEAPRFEVPES
ncbi:MAG: NAD(P)-binding domain-containing protein [Thermoanaerobaculia bacterium]